MVELSITAFLRTVGAPYRLDLEPLERKGDLVLVLNYETRKWNCKVIAETFFADFERQCLAVVSVFSTLDTVLIIVYFRECVS